MSATVVLIAVISLVVSSVATVLMRRWAPALGFVDVPNARSSHSRPTARGGGIAIVLAFFFAVVLLSRYGLLDFSVAVALICSGSLVAIIGFIDDKHHVSAAIRLGVHAAAALLAIFVVGLPGASSSNWSQYGIAIGGMFAVLGVIWGVNLFNFMDGIDGIAGSEAVFIMCAASLLSIYVGGDPGITGAMICLGAACAGFLFFNWPPASIFMGDVGSGFLGLTITILALSMSRSANIPLEVWPILGGVFLVDATVTVIRRMLRGDRWREAHCTHAYQRLAQMFDHRSVTLGVCAINIFWLFPWALYSTLHPADQCLYAIVALLPLVAAAILLGAGIHRS